MAFCSDILKCTDEDGGYFLCRMAFRVGGKVMLHNVQIWGFEYPKQLHEHISDIFVNNQLGAQFFLYMFISILYMFRASVCSSSGESVSSIRHLVYVTLCS